MGGPGRPLADASSPGTRLYRHGLHCLCARCCMHPPPPIDHTFKGGELSYMTLAMQREQNAYRSLLMLAGAVLADPEPRLKRSCARQVRGCITMAFTAKALRATALL